MKNIEQWLKNELTKNLAIIKEINKESERRQEDDLRGDYGKKGFNRLD